MEASRAYLNIEKYDYNGLIECGSVLILRTKRTAYLSCSFCDLKLQDLEAFLKHTYEMHINDESQNEIIFEEFSPTQEDQQIYSDTERNDETCSEEGMADIDHEPPMSSYTLKSTKAKDNLMENCVPHLPDDVTDDCIDEYPSSLEYNDESESSMEETIQTEEFEMVLIATDGYSENEKATKRKKATKHDKPKLVSMKNFTCETCGKNFANRPQLKQHVRRHGVKSHVCEFCGARFADSSNWKVHRYRHLGIKPHPCNVCDKRFISTSELKTHVRSHTGERPFECTECGKCFRHAGLLTKHRRRHTNDRRYVCATCGKRFYEMNLLRQHESSHSSERLFACKICDQKFARRNVLYQHNKLHSAIKQYSCGLCPKTFAQYAGLHSHKKSNHKSLKSNKN